MSTRALIIRKKDGVYQYGQSMMYGGRAAEMLNEWVPLSAENRDWFLQRMFETEYEVNEGGVSFKEKGLGLRRPGSDRESTEFFADCHPDDTSEWRYNNGEISVEDPAVSTERGLAGWLGVTEGRKECIFDWPEYIVIWSDSQNKFLSFPINDSEGGVLEILKTLKSL